MVIIMYKTEMRNPATMHIDSCDTSGILRLIQDENSNAVKAVEAALPAIKRACDALERGMKQGGRLIYIGAGTSGRLGVLDAVECPPTYGVPQDLVVGIIAGGMDRMFLAAENAEDSGENGLIENFKKAVGLRKLGSMTGWSLAHMSAIYARLGEKEKAFDAVNMMTKVCLLENFFTLHNDYRNMGITMEFEDEKMAPVQLDALMGTVNAIQEMLIRVTKKKVYVLPACSEKMSQGSAKGLCFFGGKIDMEWNLERKEYEIRISADRDVTFELMLPFEKGSRSIAMKKGEVYGFSKGM